MRRMAVAFVLAVVIAVAMTATAEAFTMPCFDWWGWYEACFPI